MKPSAYALFCLALGCSAIPAPAQTTTTAHPAASTAHHAHAGAAAKPAACPPEAPAPALPPGVPAAAGKLETAFALRYIDTVVGTGDPVTPGEFLSVHYTGWLLKDGTKFDSSLDRGEPITFQQGAHRVISGWDQGFTGMRVGGKRRLFIPYQLAYGDQGHPPVIPPQSDLIFDIELVAAGPTNPPTPPSTPTASPAPQH